MLLLIIFVLLVLFMIGWWSGFLYWIMVVVCVLGGIFGVMYLILLCCVFVIGLDLLYLEGVVGVEVFKIGDFVWEMEYNCRGIGVIVLGVVVVVGYVLLVFLWVINNLLLVIF